MGFKQPSRTTLCLPTPSGTSTHTNNAQQVPLDTPRCIKPSRTLDTTEAVDMHIEVSSDASEPDSKCPTDDNFTFSKTLQFVESERKIGVMSPTLRSMRKPWHTRTQLPGCSRTSILSQKLNVSAMAPVLLPSRPSLPSKSRLETHRGVEVAVLMVHDNASPFARHDGKSLDIPQHSRHFAKQAHARQQGSTLRQQFRHLRLASSLLVGAVIKNSAVPTQ